MSSLVVPRFGEKGLGNSATAFVANHDGMKYLVTNWHVVTSRDPADGSNLHPAAAWPNNLVVLFAHVDATTSAVSWAPEQLALYDSDGRPEWFEHPEHGRRVDAVALALTGLTHEPPAYEVEESPDSLVAGVAEGVSIIGFPFGTTGGAALGIWVQGTLATEPSVDYNAAPCFLVDSRTRPGQSGSPTILYAPPGATRRNKSGGTVMGIVPPRWDLLGVYSGRINKNSDLGFVWKVSAIREIIEGQTRGTIAGS
jgi:hypothetical protein